MSARTAPQRRITRLEASRMRLEALLSGVPGVNDWRHRVVVLCYHSVHPSGTHRSTTPSELFERHMRWLREHCDIVPFIRAWEEARRPERTRPAVAVTFDDGFADTFTYAVPPLLEYQVPATFFVTTGLIDRLPDVIRARSWHGWLDETSTLTWGQILELRGMGMEIGSHGHTHRVLTRLEDEDVMEDLATSRKLLEDRLDDSVTSFAYPRGRPRRDLSSRTVRLASEVGYEHGGVILMRGVKSSDSAMRIPRFPIASDPLSILRGKVSGSLDVMGYLQEWAPPRFMGSGRWGR
jgi:peptidoglycan/xylan/chitin deacetylase (PgdA/CDA1 family)